MSYYIDIGLEVHAELMTHSKMFCSCAVVDSTQAEPNTSVCPVCAGMPGVLPVVNRQAVELAIRVALALGCQVASTSLFARKNYYYPDLPKGYQISQFEYPLAEHGVLMVNTSLGERTIRVHRAHLEEDAGKLIHVTKDGHSYSLVDLNRAGVPLLEIVSEPDMHSVEDARAYAMGLHSLIRTLKVCSGDMEKGVMRFEANVSMRPSPQDELGTRVEIKNLNSFKSMERAILFELDRQQAILESGGKVSQETVGWDDAKGATFLMRSKEEAHDYRYFPEPDLPPLVVEAEWVERVRSELPELPFERAKRLESQYHLRAEDARLLVEDYVTADYFEQSAAAAKDVPAQTVANWVLGELGAWMNQSGEHLDQLKVKPEGLAELLVSLTAGKINQNTAKSILNEMLQSGQSANAIIKAKGLEQVSDSSFIADLVKQALAESPDEVASYLKGKETLENWFFGQVMKAAKGRANPGVVREELHQQLIALKENNK